MKLNFSKSGNKSIPSVKSLRPVVFNVGRYWYASLGSLVVATLVFGAVGFWFFYIQYFENSSESKMNENLGNVINTERLKSVIEGRNEFINGQISLPEDPSL